MRFALSCAVVLAVAGPALAEEPAPAMIGPAGEDADGYPLQTADKRAVLRLLRAGRFDALDDWIADLQAQFEADYHKEYWPIDALEAFGNADPTLAPLLDEWVDQRPDSWAALAARGIYQEKLGWHRRGYKWADETPPANFRRMAEAHIDAVPDLEEALRRKPDLMAVHRAFIWIATANSLPLTFALVPFADAVKRCPDCFVVRASMLYAMTPRWGGSYRKMRAFAKAAAQSSANPKMKILAGFADADRCDFEAKKKHLASAFEACDAALAASDYWGFHVERSDVLRYAGRYIDALVELDRAAALRPQHLGILERRLAVLQRLRLYERVAADTALLREIDPTEGIDKGDVPFAAQGLQYEAAQRRKAGHPGGEVTLLRRAVALQPDDLDAHLRLDAALARAGKLAEVVVMWNHYLARHPDSGRAHAERGGALHRLGREAEAQRDVRTACQLGETAVCGYVSRDARGSTTR